MQTITLIYSLGPPGAVKRSVYERWVLILALVGVALSLYGVYLHFDTSGEGFCNVSETINCDKVNKSIYSEFLGIPVAFLGLFGYLVVFLLVFKRRSIQESLGFTRKDFWQYAGLLILAMLAFQLYLTYAEIFLIRAYCVVCLGSQLAILLLAAITWLEYKTS